MKNIFLIPALLMVASMAHAEPGDCVSECRAGKSYDVRLKDSSFAAAKTKISVSPEGIRIDCKDISATTCDEIYYSENNKAWCYRAAVESSSACHQIMQDGIKVNGNNVFLRITSSTEPDKYVGRLRVDPDRPDVLIFEQGSGSRQAQSFTASGDKPVLEVSPRHGPGKLGYEVKARPSSKSPSSLGAFERSRNSCNKVAKSGGLKIADENETPPADPVVELGDGTDYAARGCEGSIEKVYADAKPGAGPKSSGAASKKPAK